MFLLGIEELLGESKIFIYYYTFMEHFYYKKNPQRVPEMSEDRERKLP